MNRFFIVFFIQIFYMWEVCYSDIGQDSSCTKANQAFLVEVNKDYADYQKNETNKDDLSNNLNFARQILQHYKDHFNLNCSTIFKGNFANSICSEKIINSGMASNKKDMARELLDHCSLDVYGRNVNQMANGKINSLDGKSPPPSCENDVDLKMYYFVDGGCKDHQIKTSNDWGCDIYNKRKGQFMTGWPQTDPLQLKRAMAHYAFSTTVDKVPSTCEIKIGGPFFNNYICSKEDIDKEAKKTKDALSQFNKENSKTHISNDHYKRFNTTLELLEYCSADMFPGAKKWAKEKIISLKKMEEHEAIQLKKKESCSDIDLRKEGKSRNNKLPAIRDQDTVGWCFAYVGADFLSYYTGKNLSAFALSIKNYQEELKKKEHVLSDLSGGNLRSLLERVKNDGRLCTEDQINSEDVALTGGLKPDLQRTLKSIEYLFNQKEENDITALCNVGNHLSKLFPNLNMQDFIDILKVENEHTVFISLIEKACDKKNSVPLPRDFSINSAKFKTLDELHEILDRKDLFAATFDVSLIVSDMERTLHMNTIVGRRYNQDKKRCEFLLRNTWGETCYPQYKHACEGGHLWVPERDLMKGLVDVYYKQ